MTRVWLAVASISMFLPCGRAQARDARQGEREAKLHFEEAQRHFAVGEFEQASAEYQLAYKTKPDPALLYDAAQALRLANQPVRALMLYRNYVQFFPNESNVPEVQQQIKRLREAIASAETAKTSPPDGVKPPRETTSASARGTQMVLASSASPDGPRPSATSPENQTLARTRPPQVTDAAPLAAANDPQVADTGHEVPTTRPLYKQWWLWTIVGAVAVGAAVGVGVGVAKATTPWANGPTVGLGSNALVGGVRW